MIPLFPGQRWTYRTRPGEETSTALILHYASKDDGGVVNVRLDGLRIPFPQAPQGFLDGIQHLPISEEKFRESITELIDSRVAVPEDEGYLQWRELFDKGEAGIFTLTLAEVVDSMAQSLQPSASSTLFQKSNAK